MNPLRSTPDGEATSATSDTGSIPFESWDRPRSGWMLPGRCRTPRRRTPAPVDGTGVTAAGVGAGVAVVPLEAVGPEGGLVDRSVQAAAPRTVAGSSTEPSSPTTIDTPPTATGEGATTISDAGTTPAPSAGGSNWSNALR